MEESPVPPACLEWSSEEVAEWIVSLGFPQYQDCFISNRINGRKLIWVEAAKNLPNMGITDWKHIQIITGEVRKLLKVQAPDWNRSITLPYRCDMGIYLDKKGRTGIKADKTPFDPAILSS